MKFVSILSVLILGLPCAISLKAVEKPNVILIVCDDLNDYISSFGGHPQAKTPNMARLAESGVTFQQAHCNIPICAPSRSSFLTGIYPHTSRNFGFDRWDKNEVLKNSRTLMGHFRANGYQTLGTGKLMHHEVTKEWSEWGNDSDYGPFAFDGMENVAHPDVPSPMRDEFGAVDGSLGPLVKLEGRTFPDGKTYSWKTGNWRGMRDLRVESDDDRDPTADEINGKWAVTKLKALAAKPGDKPFFMGVGFLRPHTPLIVPQRFFDMFPLDTIQLPVIKAGDADDTYLHTAAGTAEGDLDRGAKVFKNLSAAYGSDEEGLKQFIQAYLACVASVDELVGEILDTLDGSSLKDNTIVILTSDHGWQMGEKGYVYKNSPWDESTRIPLIVRAPGFAKGGTRVDQPVSLIDVYPTLIDLCGLTGDTRKNDKGHVLEGFSFKPLLTDPDAAGWAGPDAVLTSLFKWAQKYDPAEQSYTLRSKDWRYIRYGNGKEELYHNAVDPHEWTNLAANPEFAPKLESFRSKLAARLPEGGEEPVPVKTDGEAWKDKYFAKHPDADEDKDGTLSWAEYKKDKARRDAEMEAKP